MTPPNGEETWRFFLTRALGWREAHATLEQAVDGWPLALRGRRLDGFPHSAWELLEHVRIAQHDLLDFCCNPHYVERHWPDDYWPPTPAPPTPQAWDDSVARYVADRAALRALVADPATDLAARIPHGDGQTYLREVLLAVDHASYHVGQLVALRQVLGVWQSPVTRGQ